MRSRRRQRCSVEPVEADIVEHRIGGELIFRIAVIVGPCLELLVDPERLTAAESASG